MNPTAPTLDTPAPVADPLAGHDVQIDTALAARTHDAVLAQLGHEGVLAALRALKSLHGAGTLRRKVDPAIHAALGVVLDAFPLLVAAIGTAAGATVTPPPARPTILGADGASLTAAPAAPTPLDLARHVGAGLIAAATTRRGEG
jgi:hypothetical protein